MIDIDNYLLALDKKNILNTDIYDDILLSFLYYPDIIAIKYNHSVIKDISDYKSDCINNCFIYELPKAYTDIINNIRCFINDVLIPLNNIKIYINDGKNEYTYDIDDLTIPICNIIYNSIYLLILVPYIDGNIKITYDQFLLPLDKRSELRKHEIINKKGIIYQKYS
jgi:hypothetical protein